MDRIQSGFDSVYRAEFLASMDAHPGFTGTLDPFFSKGLHELIKHKTCCFPRKSDPFASLNARAYTADEDAEPQNSNLPRRLPKDKKKPYVVPPKRGGFLANKGPKKPLEDISFPPGNGLLVPELIPVAHAVYEARETLLQLVAKLMEEIPAKACMHCDQIHIGSVGHALRTCEGPGSDSRHGTHVWTNGGVSDVISDLDTYHFYDRFKLMKHDDRFRLKRIPAVVELCIQAGVDVPDYPVLRRNDPVRSFGRKIVDAHDFYFTLPAELDFSLGPDVGLGHSSIAPQSTSNSLLAKTWQEFPTFGDEGMKPSSSEEVKQMAETALRLWEVMRSGAEKLMKRYTVRACGYCPEVNIGPRGHMVRLCGAFKHQWRQGKHGWQIAGIDDLIPPKYVWHVPDLWYPLLSNEMRRFYGQTPAIVELCVQAGAEVPPKYRPMMRMDVVTPTTDEARRAV